ncbi:MAG: alpha/beta hydrolase [Gammaproteobacteria bacterium]|nr:MAG: alpha/beta hydrolase [Gammaproteobacteria bacterium]
MKLNIDNRTVHVATGNQQLDPALETVVFIHGVGQDHTIWVLPTRYFVRHGRNVLAVSTPGHGRSAGPPLASIEDIADWITRVMDAAGIVKAAVVGHSMGSLVALETAVRHPDRVRAIALVGTAVPMPVTEELLDRAQHDEDTAIEMLTLWGYSRSAQIGGNATPGMWMVGGGRRLLQRSPPGSIYADLKACNDYVNGLEHAGQLQCPALLILGERDLMTPTRVAAALAEAIPDSESVILPRAGHALLAERPDPVLDQLIRIV